MAPEKTGPPYFIRGGPLISLGEGIFSRLKKNKGIGATLLRVKFFLKGLFNGQPSIALAGHLSFGVLAIKEVIEKLN
jgi:hypothetical protein